MIGWFNAFGVYMVWFALIISIIALCWCNIIFKLLNDRIEILFGRIDRLEKVMTRHMDKLYHINDEVIPSRYATKKSLERAETAITYLRKDLREFMVFYESTLNSDKLKQYNDWQIKSFTDEMLDTSEHKQ